MGNKGQEERQSRPTRMADSQRKTTSNTPALQSDGQSLKDTLTLVGFLIGGIGLVSGMLWLADGLSTDFKVASVSFILFVVCMSITAGIFLANKFAVKE